MRKIREIIKFIIKKIMYKRLYLLISYRVYNKYNDVTAMGSATIDIDTKRFKNSFQDYNNFVKFIEKFLEEDIKSKDKERYEKVSVSSIVNLKKL